MIRLVSIASGVSGYLLKGTLLKHRMIVPSGRAYADVSTAISGYWPGVGKLSDYRTRRKCD